jgi:hypothetical protein
MENAGDFHLVIPSPVKNRVRRRKHRTQPWHHLVPPASNKRVSPDTVRRAPDPAQYAVGDIGRVSA